MTLADHGVAAGRARRLGFALGPVLARAWRVTRQHRFLLAVAVLVMGGGGAASTAVATPNPFPAALLADCGSGVSGPGFRVFACMSGGGGGHLHPKELLVVRRDGSSVTYPAFRVGELTVGDGEVVATYNVSLVRVTSSRLVPLLTKGELARALHLRSAAIIVMGTYNLRVDAHRDIYFVASVLSRGRRGCRNPLLERTAGGTVRQIRVLNLAQQHLQLKPAVPPPGPASCRLTSRVPRRAVAEARSGRRASGRRTRATRARTRPPALRRSPSLRPSSASPCRAPLRRQSGRSGIPLP